LIYAEENSVKKKFKLHKKIEIDSAFSVDDVNSSERVSFDIVNSKRSFRVYVKNEDDKKRWMDAFNIAMTKERIIDLEPGPHGLTISGKEVTIVQKGSTSEKAGIRPGWVVVKVNRHLVPEDDEKIINEIQRTSRQGKTTTIMFLARSDVKKAQPVWTRDQAVKLCPLCDRKFTMSYRRHHCRACGSVVCSKCSNFKIEITPDATKPSRVCTKCHYDLTKGDGQEGIENRRRMVSKVPHVAPSPQVKRKFRISTDRTSS